MTAQSIYLDANATAKIRPAARQAMLTYLDSGSANPSSVHQAGRLARAQLRQSRDALLSFLGLTRGSAQIVFTSGGTESCHLALHSFLGPFEALSKYPAHVVTTAVEHAAMRESILRLGNVGWEITEIPCDAHGCVAAADVCEAIRQNTAVVSIMAANNETGSIQPLAEIAAQLRAAGYRGPIISDMVQAVGKCTVSAAELFASGVDAVALSGHKLGAPAGIGAVVYAKSNDRCFQRSSLFVGGAQEERMRAGTENIVGIVALGAVAKELSVSGLVAQSAVAELREQLWRRIDESLEGLTRITPENPHQALCNTLCIAVEGCRGDDLVVALDLLGVAISTGAACSSGKQSRSHVVDALDLPESLRDSVVRISLDWDCSSAEIERAGELLIEAVRRMRASLAGPVFHASC